LPDIILEHIFENDMGQGEAYLFIKLLYVLYSFIGFRAAKSLKDIETAQSYYFGY